MSATGPTTPGERAHVVRFDPSPAFGDTYTCEVCGATGTRPPTLPCLGPRPAPLAEPDTGGVEALANLLVDMSMREDSDTFGSMAEFILASDWLAARDAAVARAALLAAADDLLIHADMTSPQNVLAWESASRVVRAMADGAPRIQPRNRDDRAEADQ